MTNGCGMAMLSGKGGGGMRKKKSEMFSVPVPSPAALKRLWQQGAGSHKKPQYGICDVGGVWGEGLCGAGELRAYQRQHLCGCQGRAYCGV